MTQSVSKGNRYSVMGERIRLPLKTLHENIPLEHLIFHCLALCFSTDFWDRLFFMSSTTALAVPLYLPRMLPWESLIAYTVISYIFAGDALKFWSFFPRFNREGTRRNNSLNGAFQANICRFPQNQSEGRVKCLPFTQESRPHSGTEQVPTVMNVTKRWPQLLLSIWTFVNM